MKPFFAISTVVLLAGGALLGFALPTNATTATDTTCVATEGVAAYDETVVDTAAYDEVVVDSAAHWQRYSWTGGPIADDVIPSFPDDAWQPNVAGDPQKIGVPGAYFVSHGGSGKGDWFYLEAVPEVTHTVHHDAVTHVVHHDAVDPVGCPTPTPTPTPTVATPVAPQTLAETGSVPWGGIVFVALSLLSGGVLVALRRWFDGRGPGGTAVVTA